MCTLCVEEGIIENDKLRKWVRYDVVENAQISTTRKIYEESNTFKSQSTKSFRNCQRY